MPNGPPLGMGVYNVFPHAGRLWLFLLLGLGGCAQDQKLVLPPVLPEPARASRVDEIPEVQEKAPAALRIEHLETVPAVGAHPPPAAAAQATELPQGMFSLNADGLPLNRFVHLALGEVLGLTYSMDKAVANRTDLVTVHLAQPVEAERLLGLVDGALNLFDVAVLSGKDGIRVVPKAQLRTTMPEFSQAQARSLVKLGRVIEFLPLTYAEPTEVLGFARHFIQQGTIGDVSINKRLNALIAIGEPDRVAQFRAAVALIDRPRLQGRHLRLIRPVYWQVEALAEVLQETLPAQGIPVDAAEAKNNAMLLIPVKQINALIVAAPQETWLEALLSLVRRLDTVAAVGSGRKHFVYFVRNARAEELGEVIQQIVTGKASRKPAQPEDDDGGEGGDEGERGAAEPSTAASMLTPEVEKKAGFVASSDGKLVVIADTIRNALIFVGEADAYRSIRHLLETLDRRPRQVLIEATVAEITLNEATEFGVEWLLKNVDGGGSKEGTLSTLDGLNLGGGGLTYTLVDAAGDVRLRLNAMASDGRVKILSSPRVLATDNEQARIQVGDQIQIIDQEVSDVSGGTPVGTDVVRTFKSVDTGVILEITPTINEGGLVQLHLHQEVSEARSSGGGGAGIDIFKRTVDTTMVAKSGQTVLIGGLISRNENTTKTKVPLLGDIPLLGHLFSSTQITDDVTEMLVLITPHIITGPEDAEFLTRAFREQLGWEAHEALNAAPAAASGKLRGLLQ